MITYIYKYVLPILLLAYAWGARAQQTTDLERAEHVYRLYMAEEADSLYACMSTPMRNALSPQALKDSFKQCAQLFGAIGEAGPWQQGDIQGVTLCFRDVEFTRMRLRLYVAFDADGRLNTLRLVPAPAEPQSVPMACDTAQMLERPVSVGAPGFSLPGTLTLPRQAVERGARVPCVVLVHGSGPQDRDETAGPNKPFRDLAWGLAQRGIATVRYDKRTLVYGKDFAGKDGQENYDTETVDDAVAAIRWAMAQPEVAADSVFVLGHSQGGMLAPRIARLVNGLAGVIMLAAPARHLADMLVEQSAYLSTLAGSPTPQQTAAVEQLRRQAANVKKLGTPDFDERVGIPIPEAISPAYWQAVNAYDPVQTAAELDIPLCILQGERDYQVTMHDFGLWHMALLRHKNAHFKSYPRLNHLLQEGSGKSTPLEYHQAVPVSPEVTDDVARFVRSKAL